MQFILDENDPAYPILRDGLPFVLYPDIQSINRRFKGFFHDHILSWMAIPLHAQGRLVGMFAMDGFAVNKFTEAHAHVALTFANQVAVTLENSRLYKELQLELVERERVEIELRQREVILEAVAVSAELLFKAPNWETEMDDILERLGRTIDASHAYLFEKHTNQNGEVVISIRFEWTNPSATSDLSNPIYHDMPVVEPDLERWTELIMQGQPFVADKTRSTSAEMEILKERRMKAVIDVPVFVNGKWWGIIGFDDEVHEREWTNAEVDALKVAANVLAAALENARLYAELQVELKKQVALRGAVTAITSSLHLDQVLGEICKQMASAINATSAHIANYDSSHSSFTVVAKYLSPYVSELKQVSDLTKTYYKKDGALVFDKDEPKTFAIVHVDDPGLTLWVRNNLLSSGGKSILYIPLYIQGRLIGHTELWENRRKRIFTSEEISFCQAISQQAAIAIENARLFSDLQAELATRKNLIAELESKNSELERFTYTVSHDLKSPLITIRGFLGYLKQDALAGNRNRMKSDIQRIMDATERMQRLLNELLELSRIGRLRNEAVSIPFEELVREAVELVHGRIMERGISVHIDADMPVVFGDRQRLLEVLQNLIDNAAKFMGSQPEPRIEVGQRGQEDGKLIFYVRDNGIGILPEHHDRVFGLFNKLDPNSEGTGVGLALVKRIVEIHDGRIWFESEAGKGTTFYFSLPGSVEKGNQ